MVQSSLFSHLGMCLWIQREKREVEVTPSIPADSFLSSNCAFSDSVSLWIEEDPNGHTENIQSCGGR